MREMVRNRTLTIFAALAAVIAAATLLCVRTDAATTTYLDYTGLIYEDGTYDDMIELVKGKSGTFALNSSYYPFYNYDEITSVSYASSDSDLLTVSSDGAYKAAGYGKAMLTVNLTYLDYDSDETLTASHSYYVYVIPNMEKVYLNKSELRVYVSSSYYAGSEAKVKIKGTAYNFSGDDEWTSMSVTSSKSTVYVDASLSDNVITLCFYGSGSSTIKVTLNGTTYKIKVKLIQVKCSTDSALLYPGQTKTIKVKGNVLDGTKVTWKSSNKKVATVSKSGKIKAKKAGNAIITATINGQVKVGCVVSVTTKTKVKAVKYAIKIAQTSTYSQAKRMKDGYYDCSSLVWKAYSKYGVYFGSKSYAPVAANLAKYLNSKSKLKGSYTYEDTQKMVMRAGDIIFKTGSDNGRYKGIYHVELFAGYALSYFDWEGNPVVTTTWAARGDGYADAGDLYGRP